MAILAKRGRVIDTFAPKTLEEPEEMMITDSYVYRAFEGEHMENGESVDDWLESWQEELYDITID